MIIYKDFQDKESNISEEKKRYKLPDKIKSLEIIGESGRLLVAINGVTILDEISGFTDYKLWME